MTGTDDGDPLRRLARRRAADLCPHLQTGEVPELGEGEYAALKADIPERGLQVRSRSAMRERCSTDTPSCGRQATSQSLTSRCWW